MERFDERGRLVFPEPEKLKEASKEKGVVVGERALLITKAFCPSGHQLVTDENEHFRGHPGIRILAKGTSFEQAVTLSPFQGDVCKSYQREFQPGEILIMKCPHCGEELPKLAPCGCQESSQYVALFLNEKKDFNDAVSICNAWGCPRSFLRLAGDTLSWVHLGLE